MADQPIAKPPAENWENEGGSLDQSNLAATLGITIVTSNSYRVGEYRYTNLVDAIAQGKRMQDQAGTS